MFTTTARIAAAAGVGYALGRSKKLKLTVLTTALIAGRDLVEDVRFVGIKALERNPELEHLGTQLTEELPNAAMDLARATSAAALATSASAVESASSGVDSVAETLEGAARAMPGK